MVNNIYLNNKNWHKQTDGKTKVWLKCFANKKKINQIINEIINLDSIINLSKYLKNLDLNFVLIVCKNKELFAATDRIRSFPLLYYINKKNLWLFENYSLIQNKIKNNFDEKQILFFSLSGYSFSDGTIFKDVKQINPGSIIHFSKGIIEKRKYINFYKKKLVKSNNYENELKILNKKIIFKLINYSKNKYIVIPLSAGYDSRFILSGLKAYGHKNVITFSYGREKNREARIAKTLAHKLGVPWYFIPYNNKLIKKTVNTDTHKQYEKYSDNLTSIHFPQDFFAIKHLHDHSIIPKDSVIVNGQSGDFISGNHLPNFDYKNDDIIEKIISYYIFKHCNLWKKYYVKKKSIISELIVEFLKDEINQINKKNIHTIYENLEFENRQCKYVINGQRLYEFFNYDWKLPLWDYSYIDFWGNVPLNKKINQKLYKKVLYDTNWCQVWHDIPLNPKNNFSFEINMIRNICKCFFLFLGKNKWHAFEKKYLNYFMDPLCGFANWDYKNIIKDNRSFRNSLSWQTDSYLKNKNIDWETLI